MSQSRETLKKLFVTLLVLKASILLYGRLIATAYGLRRQHEGITQHVFAPRFAGKIAR